MPGKHHRALFALVALIAIGIVLFHDATPVETPATTMPTPTTLAPTTATTIASSTSATTQTAPTTVGTEVAGKELSHTGSTTLPLAIAGVVLVALGCAFEVRARRRDSTDGIRTDVVAQQCLLTDVDSVDAPADIRELLVEIARRHHLTVTKSSPRGVHWF